MLVAIAALTYCAFAGQEGLQSAGLKRIYIEPFTVKAGSKELKRNIVVQLRRLDSITVVAKPSEADAVLSGQGEIWVRGYRSLNPRSGRSPFDGTPVYNGFLSVELKDRKGETLWSYLVTPPPSENIAKELSKQVERHLAEALESH